MKWEYRFEQIDVLGTYTDRDEKVHRHINALGDLGWELVSIFVKQEGVVVAVFKRQIPTEVKPR